MIPLGNGIFAEVDEIDLLFAVLEHSWTLDDKGYPRSDNLYLHQFVGRRMGLIVVETIDHKDRNPLNCRRANLRVATRSEQSVNRGLQSSNQSGYKCISWYKYRNKWRVQIHRNGRKVHVGLFIKIEDAVVARDRYLKQHGLEII